MSTLLHDSTRCFFLKTLFAAGAMNGPLFYGLVRLAGAMGKVGITQGMRTVEGDVKINGAPAAVGDLIHVGDVVTTGPNAMAIFVIGNDAYLLRADASVTLDFESTEGMKEKAVKESVRTTYHESPRFVYAAGAEEILVKAPVINHTDEELIMLEELVWRRPPFMDSSLYGGPGGPGGGGGGY